MEESSEAHMETDVSSTTDDSQEVQVVSSGTSSRRDVQTSIVVESIKEEDTSPRRNIPQEKNSTNKPEPVKITPTLQEVTIKKIVIKSPVKPLQHSSSKSDMPKKIIIKYASPNKYTPPSTDQQSDDVVDSSNNSENQTVSYMDIDNSSQNTMVETSDSQKQLQKSPTKDSQAQDSATATTSSPSKDTPLTPVKEQGSKTTPTKETPVKVSPVKYQPAKTTPSKALTSKAVTVKESPTKLGKETPSKSSPIKVITATSAPSKEDSSRIASAKETQSKSTPIKDSSKPSSTNEIPSKPSPTKETPSKPILTNETPSKPILSNETPSKPTTQEITPKPTPTKGISCKSTPTKEIPSKPTPANDDASKSAPSKETPAMSTPVKQVSTKTPQVKESTCKLTPAKEPPPKPPSTETAVEKPVDNKSKMEEGGIKNKNLSILEDTETSNDSQMETNSDTSEKEHNKSISRELRSLINSAKESKIISECTQLTSKTRKSRAPVDSANTSVNTSVDADKIQGVRRGSDNSQISNSSEKSDKPNLKRSMRSQNPEFVTKVKNFLNTVSGKPQKPEVETPEEHAEEKNKEKEKDSKEPEKELTPTVTKKRKTDDTVVIAENANKIRMDTYCWRCHWAVAPGANEKVHVPMHCSVCPRSFHFKCLTTSERNRINVEKNWVCPECMLILQAENSDTRSPAMKKITLGMLCDLLRHALDRMMEVNGVEPFTQPVDRNLFPDYDKYVVHPMDLGLMRKQIDDGHYGSTEAFLCDCQWILHNSIIFNTLQAKLTGGARALVRSCRAETSEIEACPECYAAAHARRPTWFTDVCSTPHILLWAKLKGFPYWPAKGMSVNCAGLVDVRFFGAHDRAWVPAKDCFLYSEKDPNNFRTKRQDILDSMQEAEQHIRNISRKYGKFVYPPFKTQLDPSNLNDQIKMMIPSFEGEVRSVVKENAKHSSPSILKEKSRSNSKSSKGSFNDGDTSDGEDNDVKSRKMADGAEIAREEEDFSVDKEKDKNKTMEVETPQSKETEASRKRRRSGLEEAVITIIDSTKEKRKKVENEEKRDDKKDVTKEENKQQDKAKETDSKPNIEPSTSTGKKASPKVTSIRVISIAKIMKNAKTSPKITVTKDEEKPPAKQKKVEKPVNEKEKVTPEEDNKSQKRRNSKNKSLNNSNVGKTDKVEKKNEKAPDTPKDTAKDSAANKSTAKDSSTEINKNTEMVIPEKTAKERLQFDDDTSLAVLAREGKVPNTTGLPTISCVRSLSTTAGKTVEVNLASSDCSIFTPTSTDNVRNMKEAVNKLQKLRGETTPPVGRVGVRAFARMTSPPDREIRPKEVEVEIKSEPIDIEESERQMQEKMDLMNAFRLRPVNPQATQNLRDVRFNKIVVAPPINKKVTAPTQPAQIRPRAKKTFPQPKKPDEGRSELTSKNSMVYIPIQPPTTQAPVRGARPVVTTPTSVAQRAVTPLNSNTDPAEVEEPRVPVNAPQYCFVPYCRNVWAKKYSKKMFFTVPNAAKREWCKVVKIQCPKRSILICEDHLNLAEDLENYKQWSRSKEQPRLRHDVPKGLFTKPNKPQNANKPGLSLSIPPWISKNNSCKVPTASADAKEIDLNTEGKTSNCTATEKENKERIGADVTCAMVAGALPSTQANSLQLVNTMTPPLVPSAISTFTSPTTSTSMSNPPTLTVPTVGQVPTTVHTMPLITSVNGQWTFSLQPVLSVGGVDGARSPPIMNGLPDRSLVPIAPAPAMIPSGAPAIMPPPGPIALGLPSTSAPRVTSTVSSDSSTPGELPRLQQRPHLMNPFDVNSPMGNVPPPSTVGPLTAKLNQNAVKLTDFFRTLLEDSIEKVSEPLAQLTSMKMQLEQSSWRHQQEIDEIKHNHELTLAEMRSSFEKEKARLVADARRQAQLELDAAVKLAKAKQWCANCNQEAQFYCCWNTSYCDYPCQRAHWAHHYAVCTQQRAQDNNGDSSTNSADGRLPQPPDTLPKTTAAPNLTPGNKLAPTRVYAQDKGPKASIIVSMMEDNSGNQTMKCVGTFKPPAAPLSMSPLILNKQIMNSEESAKKVVTSGGYLIVGATNSVPISTTMTPARRAQAIQYIS